ncbi:MAG: DUF3141 domain-containing protein [Rhodomicrobium sp.]
MTDANKAERPEAANDSVNKSVQQAQEQSQLLMDLAKHHAGAIGQTYFTTFQRWLSDMNALAPSLSDAKAAGAFKAYAEDRSERWILFFDTLRQRGNSYLAREKDGFKLVLVLDYQILVDGRELDRPVNYALACVAPPAEHARPRADARPFLIIDPRAGHGSGIGGSKAQSEVGVPLNDGRSNLRAKLDRAIRCGPSDCGLAEAFERRCGPPSCGQPCHGYIGSPRGHGSRDNRDVQAHSVDLADRASRLERARWRASGCTRRNAAGFSARDKFACRGVRQRPHGRTTAERGDGGRTGREGVHHDA